MYYSDSKLTFTEVPNEVSLTFLISGCPLKCVGCHSEHAKNPFLGTPLTITELDNQLSKYDGFITTVCFLGGDWMPSELSTLLSHVKQRGFKTALYSGKTKVPSSLIHQLDFLKTGPWIERLGGLNSRATNQRFINTKTNEDLTHLFYDK